MHEAQLAAPYTVRGHPCSLHGRCRGPTDQPYHQEKSFLLAALGSTWASDPRDIAGLQSDWWSSLPLYSYTISSLCIAQPPSCCRTWETDTFESPTCLRVLGALSARALRQPRESLKNVCLNLMGKANFSQY